MSKERPWVTWCNIDYSSGKHNPDIAAKVYYDMKPSKSNGGGCNFPGLNMCHTTYTAKPETPIPFARDINDPGGGMMPGITRMDRLNIVKAWRAEKKQEIARRWDSRYAMNILIPVPNALDTRQAVLVGHEICKRLFGDHVYSFSVHCPEKIGKSIAPDGSVVKRVERNQHIHIIFNERSLKTGKKVRDFKAYDVLRQKLNIALADSLSQRGYEVITGNKGAKKRIRETQAKKRLIEMEEKLEVEIVELRHKLKGQMSDIVALETEIEDMEQVLLDLSAIDQSARHERQEKSPGKNMQNRVEIFDDDYHGNGPGPGASR